MTGRLFVTLAIIVGIGVGTGALVFGTLMLTVASYNSGDEAMIASAGAGLLAASGAALVAHIFGGFKQLDERDDREY